MSGTGEPTWQDQMQELADTMEQVAQRLRSATALFDPVTGLVSGAYLELRLHEEVSRAERLSIPFSLVALSIVSHAGASTSVGSALLRQVGQVLRGALRGMDVLAPANKLEFLCLLPEATAEEANLVANRLVGVVSAAADKLEGVRIVAGTATYPEDGAEPDALLSAARLALLRVRTTGVTRRKHPEQVALTAQHAASTVTFSDQAAGLRNAAAMAGQTLHRNLSVDSTEVPVSVGFAEGGHFPVSFWNKGNLVTIEAVLEEHSGENTTHLMAQTAQGIVRLTRRGRRWFMGAWVGDADPAGTRGA